MSLWRRVMIGWEIDKVCIPKEIRDDEERMEMIENTLDEGWDLQLHCDQDLWYIGRIIIDEDDERKPVQIDTLTHFLKNPIKIKKVISVKLGFRIGREKPKLIWLVD